jgi:hypothetical protein
VVSPPDNRQVDLLDLVRQHPRFVYRPISAAIDLHDQRTDTIPCAVSEALHIAGGGCQVGMFATDNGMIGRVVARPQ